jgi:hypothetical protein
VALDEQLDGLIQRARGAEAPTARERADVRLRLQQQLATGARDLTFEEAVLPRAASRWPRALAWGAPLVGIGVLALIVLQLEPQLAPQPVDPLVRAPQAPTLNAAPPPPAAAPTVEPTAAATSALPAAATSNARAPAVPAPRAPALRAPDLLAESQALARVQRALRDGQPQQALTLLAQQEREFSRGALHEERAAARALALCSAGRGAEGQRAAAAFAVRYPQSVLGARVQSRCAIVRDEVRDEARE